MDKKMNEVCESIGNKIYGTWKLMKFVYKDQLNKEEKYFGQSPEGILIYERSGFMSVHIAQEDRPNFETDSFDGGTEQDKARAFSTFFSYYGRFVEEAPGKLAHTIVGSLFPNWIGQVQIRYGRLENDLLYLTTPPIASMEGYNVFEIVWKKVTK